MKSIRLASFAALYCAFTIAKDEESQVYRGTNCWDLERFANACTGAVARVVYARAFPSLTKPQTGRLNKSPHTVHAIANRHKIREVKLWNY